MSPKHWQPTPAFLFGLALGSLACRASSTEERPPMAPFDLPVSMPPYRDLQASWKERMALPYVFVEMRGSYSNFGSLLNELMQKASRLQIEPAGPPFGLFYDDPDRVDEVQLRSRACLPVRERMQPGSELASDDLPGGVVVYGFAGGPYPKIPLAYERLFDFMEKMRWVPNGPIREIYLIDPAEVASPEDLVAEVQLPAGPPVGPPAGLIEE